MLATASSAWGGSITITVVATADQEIALSVSAQAQADSVTKRNAEAAAWNAANPRATPKPITPVLSREEWLRDQVVSVLDRLVAQNRGAILRDAQAAFEAASPEAKTALCAALGLKGRMAECP